MSKIPEIVLPYCRPALRYRGRSQFIDEVKRIAKRQKGSLMSLKDFKPASYQECLESVAQDLGFASWHQLVHSPHPENCESEVFLSKDLVEQFATRLDFVDPPEQSRCAAPGCEARIDYKVFLFDYYKSAPTEIFLQPDFSCPYLCAEHAQLNERKASGLRRPRWAMYYPFSNSQDPGKQGFNCYLPLGDSGRFKIFSWRSPTQSSSRDASFTAYVQKSLGQIDRNSMDASLEEYISDQLHQLAQRPQGAGTWTTQTGEDGEERIVERELDWRHFGIRWESAPSYEKLRDGTYTILVTGTWVYAELDFPDQPPALRLTGECFHKFSGKPRGEQLMELVFLESDADLSSATAFDWNTRNPRPLRILKGSFSDAASFGTGDGSGDGVGYGRGDGSGAGYGDGTGDGRGAGHGAGNGDGTGDRRRYVDIGISLGIEGDDEARRFETLGEYIRKGLDKVDFTELDSALEEDIKHRLSDLEEKGRRFSDPTSWRARGIDPTGFGIKWNSEMPQFYTSNEDGTLEIFVAGKWRYTEQGDYRDPPTLDLQGDCHHRFRGIRHLGAPIELEFIDSHADLRDAESEWIHDERD